MPEARAHPHQSRAFARTGRDAGVHARSHLVAETRARAPAPSRCRAPTASAITLAICSVMRTGTCGAGAISRRTSSKISSCRLTASSRSRSASRSSVRPLIASSRATSASRFAVTNASRCGSTSSRQRCRPSSHQRGGSVGRARMLDLEQLGAEVLGPEREDAVDAVAGQPGAEQARRRQPAPRRLLHAAVPRRRRSRGCSSGTGLRW